MKNNYLLLCLSIILVACSGESNVTSNNPPLASLSCSTQLEYFSQTVYPTVLGNCTGCHTGGNAMDINQATMSDNYLAFRNSALKTGTGGDSLVVLKPQGQEAHGGGNLNLSSSDLGLISSMADSIQSCNTIVTNGLLKGTPYQQLRKITFALSSRLPTDQEEVSVNTASAQSLPTVLDGMVDTLMNEEGFYTRLKEIYNDLLLTDHYIPNANRTSGRAYDEYDLTRFADTRRLFSGTEFDALYANAQRTLIRRKANIGLGRMPLELVAYVVRNNRPFTEILTADYIMVNPFSATLLDHKPVGNAGFAFDWRGQATPPDPNAYDENNFVRVDVRNITVTVDNNGNPITPEVRDAYGPAAGILSDPGFLARYPSTNTNVNRHRARIVYKYFLDTEAEGFADRTALDLDNVIGTFPTLEDPQCKACHDKIDPLAGLFKNRGNRGRYQVNNNWGHRRNPPRMLAPGLEFTAETMPDTNNANSLQWLAERLIVDDRFARVTVRHVYNGYTGRTLDNDPVFEEELKTAFVNSGFNLKTLIKTVVMSNHFLASGIDANANPVDFADKGTARIIVPEQLHRKVQAITGYDFRASSGEKLVVNYNMATGQSGGQLYPILYGGIDSFDVTQRNPEATALMATIQERVALQAACFTVAQDFTLGANARRYFKFVEITDVAPAAEAAIRQNIQYLHKLFLAEELAVDDPKVDETLALFEDVRANVDPTNTNVNNDCDAGLGTNSPIKTDNDGTVRAWMAVVTAMIMDFKFLYE